MTREEARKAAEVMLAYAKGEEIERLREDGNGWLEDNFNPLFNWFMNDYRIKPKPKFNPKTLKPFDKVLTRDNNSQKWSCNLFSSIDYRDAYPYICMSAAYNMVIPYNEETKHLVGTSNDAPEFYRYWEE